MEILIGKTRGSGEGFDPTYFDELSRLEDGNWWFRSRNRSITWALGHFFPGCRSFFEIGCGTGFVLKGIQEAFPHLILSGSELFGEGLSYARSRLPNVSFFQLDARHIPFEEEFDVMGGFDVLEHIEQDEEVLRQMFRATRKGGGILLTVPQHPFLWSYVDDISFHKRRYTRRKLLDKVEEAGFAVLWSTSFVSLLLPFMFFIRRGKRYPRGEFDPLAELKVGEPLNHLLEKIMDVECHLIRAGVSLPMGGSLLMAAKKG